jgi:tartrate-resistant acid phosphatase type 5
MSGRDGHYERLEVDGVTYFVNGPDGSSAPLSSQVPGSRCVFNEEQGAMLIEAAPDRIDFRFVTAEGLVVDAHTLRKQGLAGRAPREDGPAHPVRARPQ